MRYFHSIPINLQENDYFEIFLRKIIFPQINTSTCIINKNARKMLTYISNNYGKNEKNNKLDIFI